MTHLNMSEIIAIADGTASSDLKERGERHVSDCPVCRSELRIQLQIAGSALATRKNIGVDPAVKERILDMVVPSSDRTVWNILLNNLGNAFGLMFVTGIVGYVVMAPQSQVKSPADSSFLLDQVLKQCYSFLAAQLAPLAEVVPGHSGTQSGPSLTLLLTIVLVSLAILFALDSVISSKFRRKIE